MYVRPDYYEAFKCIASECKDNCCIGWEIDIDPETYQNYLEAEGEWKRCFHDCISHKEQPHFILRESGRCPFLNEKNLCDIITAFGEELLCNICAEHPRFHERFENVQESGIGLSCEAAAGLILSNEKPMTLLCQKEDGELPNEDYQWLAQIRKTAFEILQNRDAGIWQRLWLLLAYAEEIQECLDMGSEEMADEVVKQYASKEEQQEILKERTEEPEIFEEEEMISQIIDLYKTLEILDPAWKKSLDNKQAYIEELLRMRKDYQKAAEGFLFAYEQLAVYFVYRHFLVGLWEDCVLEKTQMSVLGCLMVYWTQLEHYLEDGTCSLKQMIADCKWYSKEIEYCPENQQALENAAMEEECCFVSNILYLLSRN